MILDMALDCAPELDFDADAALLESAAIAAINSGGCFDDGTRVELGVRLVDEAESARLNGAYRYRPHPTNVLSFPADAHLPGFAVLGDLVICGPVITREATTQGKTLEAHLSHMVVHGVLHLLGFDHIGDDEADAMETLERRVLAQLGYDDPFRERAY